jgi:hypothetical protein
MRFEAAAGGINCRITKVPDQVMIRFAVLGTARVVSYGRRLALMLNLAQELAIRAKATRSARVLLEHMHIRYLRQLPRQGMSRAVSSADCLASSRVSGLPMHGWPMVIPYELGTRRRRYARSGLLCGQLFAIRGK